VDEDARSAALARCPLFGTAEPDAVRRLAVESQVRRFRRGEVVFHAGDPGDALHIVTEGRFKVVLPSVGGQEAVVAVLEPGDFFGELSLLDGADRSATVVTVEPGSTLVLRRDGFRRALDDDPRFRDALLAAVARELRRLTRHVEDLHFLDLPGRLASQILRLAEEGVAGPDGTRIEWPYTQTDVASMIGGTRQTVNRLLGDLVDEGVIRLEPDAVFIVDIARLRRRAAW
jgi:CRP/FNR family cyclic AMP-dependent transcriptional regulator